MLKTRFVDLFGTHNMQRAHINLLITLQCCKYIPIYIYIYLNIYTHIN